QPTGQADLAGCSAVRQHDGRTCDSRRVVRPRSCRWSSDRMAAVRVHDRHERSGSWYRIHPGLYFHGAELCLLRRCHASAWSRGTRALNRRRAAHGSTANNRSVLPAIRCSLLCKGGKDTMDSAASALLGMGLAAAGFAGAGVSIGYIFGKMIEAVARQPEAEGRVGKYMWIGFALVEAIALYGLVIAFIIMGLRK